ncbi:hypothetical protein QLQ12_41850 [Actinoplanes sp. NEAU-A12]|uniref:Transmembrane protein n=1 Tax=Actinoplanes sandaracinus TaxID=3045177 RepID=A0ABT6WZI2_9ACTN|nr:hypothetical protein [Actinoplanes sandaracinus]MDI6105149.1 hypothetical protein [Actinoplanes sandaracinus]
MTLPSVLLFGCLIPSLARWAVARSGPLPMRPIFITVAAVDQPWEVAVNLILWLGLGLAVVFWVLRESTKVTITDAGVRVQQGDWHQDVARADVHAAFVDGRNIVLLDRDSRQLICERHRTSGATLALAFQAHGYPWHDGDPYAELYRRWSGAANLPPALNAVLQAREAALRRKATKEIRELRTAAQNLGFSVRDAGARQYWRPLVRS